MNGRCIRVKGVTWPDLGARHAGKVSDEVRAFAAFPSLCYKRPMRDVRDWMRDLMRRRSRRGPNNSESTGKSGQELPQNQPAPLRPSYPEPLAPKAAQAAEAIDKTEVPIETAAAARSIIDFMGHLRFEILYVAFLVEVPPFPVNTATVCGRARPRRVRRRANSVQAQVLASKRLRDAR